MDEVKVVITLRNGKQVDQPVPKPAEETREEEELEPAHIFIKEDSMKNSMPPPFPQALRGKKKASKQVGILEVLRQLKINIPLLDMIKQVPTYAKNLKDLCIVKKGLGIDKEAFLTEQVSSIIQCKTLVKYKDPRTPTISVNIGGSCIDKALLDLGASVNLLPYSVYEQLGLREMKPINITLSLADRLVKIPKGIVEDVLVKVDKFYYPVDFVVLDTELVAECINQVPIILGRPFLATSNSIIKCWNGVMQITFGNMTLELNIFHLSNKLKSVEDEEQEANEVCMSGIRVGKHSANKLQEEWLKNNEAINEEPIASVTPPALLIPPAQLESRMPNTKELSSFLPTTGASDLNLPPPSVSSSPGGPVAGDPSTAPAATRPSAPARPATATSTVPTTIQGSVVAAAVGSLSGALAQRRYRTGVNPTPPDTSHPRLARRDSPSKRAWTSGLGESSRSRSQALP